MEQLQVGRATVRAALNELEHEGQVEKRHGIGTFVKEPKRELGFEPLISLSHYLDKMGIRCVNRVVKDEPVTVEAGVLSERWAPVGWCAASSVCAMAKKSRWLWRITTLHRSFMNALPGARRSEASIAHVILTQEDLSVGKIDYSIVRRVPTEKEQAELRVLPNQRVLEMTRWLYFEGMRRLPILCASSCRSTLWIIPSPP